MEENRYKVMVDNREISVTNSLKKLSNEKPIDFNFTQLPVGDATFDDICIERKDAGDFISSLITGRLDEQTANMVKNFDHNYIIIVGDIFSCLSNTDPKSIIGEQISLTIRKNIKLIHVNDAPGYAWAIWSIISKHSDGKIFDPEKHEVHKYQKYKNKNAIISMLTVIDGISWKKSKSICDHFNYDLKSIISSNMDEFKKIKGIGERLAKNIHETLNNKGCND